mgnify:CR=1 FL=1
MELIPVKTTDPYYAEAERLMTDAFPPEERRPLDRQRQYTDHNPLFHPQVVVENGTFAGLFNYWTLDGFLYGEHLATCPSLRGGGLGRRILDTFIRHAGQPIVLEVEPPTTDIAARRIGLRLPVVGTSHLYTASLRCRPLAAPPAPYGARRFGRRERL